MSDIALTVRRMGDFERQWVLQTWKQSCSETSFAKDLFPWEFWALMNHVVDHVIFASMTVLVAAPEDEPDVALGWMAYEPGRSVYLFIKRKFHGMGIDRALYDAAGLEPCKPFNPYRELELFNAHTAPHHGTRTDTLPE